MADKKAAPEKAAPAVEAAPDPGWPEQEVPGITMASEPVIAPDGHVNLSQEDIDSRA